MNFPKITHPVWPICLPWLRLSAAALFYNSHTLSDWCSLSLKIKTKDLPHSSLSSLLLLSLPPSFHRWSLNSKSRYCFLTLVILQFRALNDDLSKHEPETITLPQHFPRAHRNPIQWWFRTVPLDWERNSRNHFPLAKSFFHFPIPAQWGTVRFCSKSSYFSFLAAIYRSLVSRYACFGPVVCNASPSFHRCWVSSYYIPNLPLNVILPLIWEILVPVFFAVTFSSSAFSPFMIPCRLNMIRYHLLPFIVHMVASDTPNCSSNKQTCGLKCFYETVEIFHFNFPCLAVLWQHRGTMGQIIERASIYSAHLMRSWRASSNSDFALWSLSFSCSPFIWSSSELLYSF